MKESFKPENFSRAKTEEYRWVDLPEFLMDELNAYWVFLKKQKLKKGISGEIDLLFVDPDEGYLQPYSQREIQSLLRKVCKKAKLSRRSPHDLRHTYVSILLMAHMSPAYVQKQLGHSSINITVDTYGHWIQGEGRHRLDEALNPVVRNHGENRILLHMGK